MVYKKNIRVEKETTDRYGRTVGFVYVDGSNLSQEIIANGYGWVYRKYCEWSFCDDWIDLERQARNAGVGLWAGDNIQPPWEWRSEKRNGGRSKVVVKGDAGVYHGNVKSKVLHGNSCKYYNCKSCTVVFESVGDALRAGYRKHKQCVE